MRHSMSDNVITRAHGDRRQIVLRLGAESSRSCSTIFLQEQDPQQDDEQGGTGHQQGIHARADFLSSHPSRARH
jgi:hypothetical protein